jgi:long-chain fatty acid transport protein
MKMRLFKAAMLITGMLPAVVCAKPLQLPVTGFTMGGSGLTPFYVLGFELGPWQNYLARELTPEYLVEPNAKPLRISWMDMESVLILPAFAEQLMGRPASKFQMQMEWQSSRSIQTRESPLRQNSPGLGFERQLLAPGVTHQFDDGRLLGVSAVFAYQSFGVAQLGMRAYQNQVPGFLQSPAYAPFQETAYGTGVRLALHQELVPGIALDADFQSRIDMEEFASYNGVYSQPADLDIPARASVGVALQASKRSWLNLSIAHVMYSSVEAFPSRLLPDRFLALLGDSTSPEFSWDDLTVYSVGWSWNNGKDTEWRFDISSRSQPLPTSNVLSRALGNSLADNAMLLGYSKRLSDTSRFSLNAAYAPAEYAFGGSVLGVVTEDLDQSIELEAFWTWDF